MHAQYLASGVVGEVADEAGIDRRDVADATGGV